MYFHPFTVNKAPIAVRIADALDGTRTRYPEISEVRIEGDKAFCRIAFADGGLRPGRAEGFTLAGENGKYYPARAEVTGKESICVYSRDVPRPRKLTYAFMQYQDFCNVRSESGAPLLPWRSDCEAVDGRYFFPPAFTVNGALRVYENNFGWEAGTCRRAPVWKNGEIYDGADTEIVSEGDCVCGFGVSFRRKLFLLRRVSRALSFGAQKSSRRLRFPQCPPESGREGDFLGRRVPLCGRERL